MAFISCFNILTSFVILMVFLTSQLEAYYTSNTGCHHNGTWYADKSLVPTTEKCLNCQCNKKTLVCRLKVCPEMPMPPPRGCVVVQKKNTCCPYLSCARLDAFYKIPATRRIIAYLDHYERESIDRVVNENMLQRRSDDSDVDLYVCVKNGTVYKSGSAMSSSNLCSYCYCIGGSEKCVKPKCMLPVEGCKPIFVDSTCCPVRYDCSTKQTGKSSQEVRYRKISNKHYMRMSQRLQRNHGCTVGQQFYTEGQKMKSDKDKSCDICFCIRGQRKCAPKKCAPALRNCIPVVPKGQCCPSSYDCGSQRDYRRSQNSRQFNLYSLLFGKDDEQDDTLNAEIQEHYPHDREPVDLKPSKYKDSTTEKSFYDTLREGLEFIDSNSNNQMLKVKMNSEDITGQQTYFKKVRPSPTPIPLGPHSMASTTEVSFLDLLLGPSEPSKEKTTENSSEELESVEEEYTTPTSSDVNWVDFLLGPDEGDQQNSATTLTDNIYKTDATEAQDRWNFESTTSIDRVDHDSLQGSGEGAGKLEADQQDNLLTSTLDITPTTDTKAIEETTQASSTTLDDTTELINLTQPLNTEVTQNTTPKPTQASTTTIKSTPTTTSEKSTKTTSSSQKPRPSLATHIKNLNKNHTQTKPEKNSDFLAQLLDGLSDILRRENKTYVNTQQAANYKLNINKTSAMQLATPEPLPIFKPLPQNKTYTRINSKIANLTVRPPIITTNDFTKPTFKPLSASKTTDPLLTLKPIKDIFTTTTINSPTTVTNKAPTTATTPISTASSTTTIATPTIYSTLKPVVIKTNPTIMESEPLDQSAAPTLPPSLPNLKIIPFLPTDAVKTDHNQPPSYEFYHHSSAPISRIDYDLYDDANLYPSITEKYPLYADLEDGSKAEYIYKFNVEGPDSLVSSNAGKFDGTLGAPAFLKYDFPGTGGTPSSTKGFSPPTKTEGGFVPKEPLILHNDDHDRVSEKPGDSYHVTPHIIDITTSAEFLNTTKVIEITTPDPFKDVIRTETPPDLTSLIEDKLKNFISKSNTTTTTATKSNQMYDNLRSQTEIEIEMYSKQPDKKPMTLKPTNQIEKTAMHIENNNEANSSQMEIEPKNEMKHRITQVFGDDMHDKVNVDVNDVSTIPPFKSLPTALQFLQDYTSTASKTSTTSDTNSKLKQTETTKRPADNITTMPVKKINRIITTTKRPTAPGTIKANRNKTIAVTTIKQTHQHQQKPTKITNKNSSSNGSEIKILTSSTTSLSSASSPAFSSSAGSLSTLKTKSNATRRLTSTKPTKHYKLATSTTLPAASTKSTPTKTNTINIAATRRTQKPTNNANIQAITIPKPISTTTKKTTTTQPSTTMRTTTSLPLSTSSLSSSSSSSLSSSSPPPLQLSSYSSSSSLLQRIPNTNPFFMSPFDKLPFMDASFEVKRNSATPPTTTATSQQHFAVAATITTDALADVANDEQNINGDADNSFTSSRHKLMGLVHYKHTLNQLEGLEPSTQQRPHQSSTSSHSSTTTTAHLNSGGPSASSTASQQQQQQHSSALNNLIDPTGILKLAGCNIYGRMYRVGRIILELSSPCLECKCTEIGVKCGPLDC